MEMGLLTVHQYIQNGKAAAGRWHWVTSAPRREPQTYKIYFPTAGGARNCPVKGCQVWAATRTAMKVHFLHRHVRYTIIILEEGNLPHPRWPRCDMLVPWKALKGRHVTTAQCAKWCEWKIKRLVEEEMQESAEIYFQDYGRPLAMVTSFKYLSKVLTLS